MRWWLIGLSAVLIVSVLVYSILWASVYIGDTIQLRTQQASVQQSIAFARDRDSYTSDINFAYTTLSVNNQLSTQVTSSVYQEQFVEVTQAALTTFNLFNQLNTRIHKYATVLGESRVRELYTRLDSIHDGGDIDLAIDSISLTKIDQELEKEVIGLLKKQGMLTTISFEDFDRYILIVDELFLNTVNTGVAIAPLNASIFNPQVDTVIASYAMDRGFLPRAVSTSADMTLVDGFLLQQESASAFITMRDAARLEGIDFFITSGFRSPEQQTVLFVEECVRLGVQISLVNDLEYISSSAFVDRLDRVLSRVAPPGFSRHHGGNTIDLGAAQSSRFHETRAYQWLSGNNYYNSKRFGFIPSYPDLQESVEYGPNPESWEYVYVGLPAVLDYENR